MKVSIEPYNSKGNKYIELIKKAITNLNINICEFNIKNLEEIEFCIFNWYESLYTRSLLSQIHIFIKKYLQLILLKLKRKKMIWVVHNRIPHDTKRYIFSELLMRYLAKHSYKILIHSNESKVVLRKFLSKGEIDKKCVYVPHPNYIGAYKDGNINKEEKRCEMLELLFIGAIKPYKNVDLLIEVFNELNLPNVKLKLCGKVMNDEYETYINKLINSNRNITTDFRFIEDDELNGLIKKSDILVLPYDMKSSLNSGTIILAFSNKRTVLSPMIGTLKDFEDKSLFFAYEYVDERTHREELKKSILKVYDIYINDQSSINTMGERCYQEVKENNSIKMVTDKFRQILEFRN